MADLRRPTVRRACVPLVAALVAAVLLVGAAGGALISQSRHGHALIGLLAFGAAALLYLVTEELLVEAHEVPETPLTTAMFVIGFLALVVIGMDI